MDIQCFRKIFVSSEEATYVSDLEPAVVCVFMGANQDGGAQAMGQHYGFDPATSVL